MRAAFFLATAGLFASCATTPVAPPPSPAAPAAEGEIKESLGPEDVMGTIMNRKPDMARCAEEQRREEPTVHGTLVVKWHIYLTGEVHDVTVDTPDVAKTHFAVCIKRLMWSFRFPPHRVAGGPIVFPFKF